MKKKTKKTKKVKEVTTEIETKKKYNICEYGHYRVDEVLILEIFLDEKNGKTEPIIQYIDEKGDKSYTDARSFAGWMRSAQLRIKSKRIKKVSVIEKDEKYWEGYSGTSGFSGGNTFTY